MHKRMPVECDAITRSAVCGAAIFEKGENRKLGQVSSAECHNTSAFHSLFLSPPAAHAYTHKHTPSHTASHRQPASLSRFTHTLKSYQVQLSLLKGRQEQHGSLLNELREGAAESQRDIDGKERRRGRGAE